MTLLNPAALIFAVLAPVIILLYLLKLRRQPARVSTLMFWQRVTADHRRRALFQRLRQVLSLLLHLLIFALLLFALARPEFASFRGGSGTASSTVVILDCGARMQTRDNGGSAVGNDATRFIAARRMTEGYLRRASSRNFLALLAAGDAPQVLAGFSGDEKSLLTGLEKARATDAGSRIEDAVSLARELLAARPGDRRIIVITDRPIPPGEEKAADAKSGRTITEWHDAGNSGTPHENVAITRLTARPLPNSPQTDEVLLEIENFGATRQTGSVELSFDGRTLDVKPYDLPPGERRTEIYPALATRTGLANARGWLTAHLAPGSGKGDASPLDDEAYSVIPPVRPLRVLLVTRGNWFLESLFKADDQIEFNQLAPDSFQPAQAAGFDAVVLDNFLPMGFNNLEGLPAGNFLFVRQAPLPEAQTGSAPPASPSQKSSDSASLANASSASPSLDRPMVTDTDKDSPLLRLADLRDISFVRTHDWVVPASQVAGSQNNDGWRFTEPVRSLEHPLVVTGERTVPGNHADKSRRVQRFVALAFSATDSVELPLRVAFPLFIRNSIAWLGGSDEPAPGDLSDTAGLKAGETLRLAVGETLWTVPQHAYQALPGNIPPVELLTGPSIFQPSQNGFYLRRSADGTAHWLAVNTFDRQVSAINGPPAAAGAQPEGVNKGVPLENRTGSMQAAGPRLLTGWWEAVRVWPPWFYLAFAALTLCTLEWWGFHRRRTE